MGSNRGVADHRAMGGSSRGNVVVDNFEVSDSRVRSGSCINPCPDGGRVGHGPPLFLVHNFFELTLPHNFIYQ